MPSGNISSSSTLQIFREASHLWGLLCPSVYLIDRFPPLWHVQGSTPTEVFKGGCRPLTHSSLGFPFHFSLFVASSLNLWRWWRVFFDCHHLRQSSGGHGWLLPPPLSSWRLRQYRLHCLYGWWSHLAWQWSPTLTGLWWLSHRCTLRSCSLLFSWMRRSEHIKGLEECYLLGQNTNANFEGNPLYQATKRQLNNS